MSFAQENLLPGITTALLTQENEFLFGDIASWQVAGILIDSGTTDAGSSPTTQLRRGLTLGIIASTGKYTAYAPGNSDGSQFPVGFLYENTNMLDLRTAAAADHYGQIVYTGKVKVGQLYGFDENARRQMAYRFIYDDFRQPPSGPIGTANLTANYTILSSDNGKQFVWNGAGVGYLTLPAPLPGLGFTFINMTTQTFRVLGGAGNVAGPGNIAAANVGLETATAKQGHSFQLTVAGNGTGYQYVNQPLNGNSAAFTYS